MEFKVNLIQEIGGKILYSYKTVLAPQVDCTILHDGFEYKVIQIVLNTEKPNVLAAIVKFVKHG